MKIKRITTHVNNCKGDCERNFVQAFPIRSPKDTVMKFHHRVTQSFTESYFLISNQLNSVRLCVTLW